MIKLIIFDLDGVLIDAKKIHYEALNKALGEVDEKYIIDESEHLSIYDGLKTTQKLELLTKYKGLKRELYDGIWFKKQFLTFEYISKLEPKSDLIDVLKHFSDRNYKLACASNSVKETVIGMLSKIGITEYIDVILSNEDVRNPKPHPEIFWTAMSINGCLPEETLIIEDSPYGLLAATKSGANLHRVSSSNELTIENLENVIENINKKRKSSLYKWSDKKLNILVPMAGAGSRFEKLGYTFPKPLIDVMGKPMIQLVVENVNIDANFIYVVQKNHREKYNLHNLLNLITPNCQIIEVDGLTEGSTCTSLFAKEYIDNDDPILIVNSDQILEWNSSEFMYKISESNCDGCIVTFKSTHPKWSFVKLDNHGFVTEVAEKNPISDIATVGIYYWRRGSDYVKYAENMINKNIRVNNEFYICPVYNEAISDGKKIKTFNVEKMWGIGTPEDLDFFLKNNHN